MKIIITGTAGFIGSAVAYKLLERGDSVFGIDNHNDYYDPNLKNDRVKLLEKFEGYKHFRLDIADMDSLNTAFSNIEPDMVINLAAQAGVRYSIENPHEYIKSNIVGFANILECCRHNCVKHLVYASSSSVYGANKKLPFSVHDSVDHPLSLYAASKKSNELMAHTYSNLYGLPTTGLRFFTVYGPWGRPDMALFKFTKAIIENKPIEVYNNGNHKRDFTYIDDIVNGIVHVLDSVAKGNPCWDSLNPDPASSFAPWRVYNIGNNSPVKLGDYISEIEKCLGKSATIKYLPLQQGDVPDAHADVTDLINDVGYAPSTKINVGVSNFISWYESYYEKNER